MIAERSKPLTLIDGQLAVDLEDISIILPPSKENQSFIIKTKIGAEIIIPASEESVAQWAALLRKCTGAELSFSDMDNKLLDILDRIAHPEEIYGDIHNPGRIFKSRDELRKKRKDF